MFDTIIIGAGPAGISASLYTKRAGLETLILYNEEANLKKAELIENYYGFENGIKGEDLYKIGIKQAKNIGIKVEKEEVTNIINNIIYEEEGFTVITDKNEYKTKGVILATGSERKSPNIKGIKEFEGKGISYCAICDGFFYKNKNVAVLGNGNYAISETNELINIVNNIIILTNGEKAPEFRAENVNIDTRTIKNIMGKDKVEEINFEDNSNIKIDGIFVAQGTAGSADFAKKLGAITKNNKIVVNENMETNIKGLYACGDCTGGLLQISKAVHEGTKAGLQMINYIKLKNK